MDAEQSDKFGHCCEAMREAMDSPQSTFRVEDGVLYLIVGRLPKHKAGFYDKAVFFCPFCGRRLQTPDGLP